MGLYDERGWPPPPSLYTPEPLPLPRKSKRSLAMTKRQDALRAKRAEALKAKDATED